MNVDTKEFKRNPEAVLQRLDAVDARAAAALRAHAQGWTEQRRRVTALRRDKQQVAVSFRQEGLQPDALENLKTRMTATSSALAEAELELKQLERDLIVWLQGETGDGQAESPDVPERFRLRCPEGEAPANLVFERLSAANRPEWDAFVAADKRASLYHFSRWESWITGALRQHSMCLLARAGKQVVGVLPLYALRSRLFGHFAVSVPYVNYGGPLGVNTGVETVLLEQASRDCKNASLVHMEVRETCARDGWPSRNDKVSMVLALPRSTAELEAQLSAKVRSQVRRGGREGVTFRSGADDRLLGDFYGVFARNMRDLGTPVYALRVFADLLEFWPTQAIIVVAYRSRRPVGAAFLLRHNDTLEVPWASTLREHNGLGLNMQLYWQILSYAIETGSMFFDFGRSTEGSGSFRFKRQWGATSVRHYWHYWLREDGQLPGLNPENSRFRYLIECWKRLPVPVTKLLGPLIVRGLP
jgi:FemAB-related protein (PEP-CTERM system-associated)